MFHIRSSLLVILLWCVFLSWQYVTSFLSPVPKHQDIAFHGNIKGLSLNNRHHISSLSSTKYFNNRYNSHFLNLKTDIPDYIKNFQNRKILLYSQNGKSQEEDEEDREKIVYVVNDNSNNKKLNVFDGSKNALSRLLLASTMTLTSALFFHPIDAYASSTTSSTLEGGVNINTNVKKSNFISSSLFEKEESAIVFQQTELGPPSREKLQAQKEAEEKRAKTTAISVSFGEERNEKLANLNNKVNENTNSASIGNSKNQKKTLLARSDMNSKNQQEQQLVKADPKLKYASSSNPNNGVAITTEEQQKNLLLEEFQDPDRIIAKGIIQLPNRNDVIGQDSGVTTVSDSSTKETTAFQMNQNKKGKKSQDNFSPDSAYLSIFSPARESQQMNGKNEIQVNDVGENMGTPTLTLTASSLNYALENDDAALLITCYGREGGPVAAKKVSLRGLTFPYQFELTVDNLLFPQTRSTWVKDSRSTDDLGISVLLDLDGQFATANENDYIGFGISKPFSIAGTNLRRDAMITVQPRTGVKEYSADEIKVLGNIDFELSRQDSGAGLAQLEEKKFQAMQKEKEQQNAPRSTSTSTKTKK